MTLVTLTLWVTAALAALPQAAAPQPGAPKIMFDAAPRAVEYQLGRLTNDELTRVERRADDGGTAPCTWRC